ncbi:UDP-glucose 4-epimerase [Desulfurella amilsii]|uniref:UDP-glucose 4-epimerase n=1 Tax=Desulfurella amilsii TaxID=1562698 RepID=A0A1X4XZT5_9BACT|nr:NAD(P)-dependent oxidoreductase [Desulfurella amilsii]OSS43038.1 UDP-glucose 4-epimerase [Desulfurella amilsii]
MKILVTGASGFVGKNLISRLSCKYRLYGFSRKKREGINYFKGDIANIEDLEKAIVNVDTVVHLAGLIRGSKKAFYTTNVLGARNLSILAAKHNIKKIIYVSSLAAKGPLEKNEPVSYYGYTKRLGELELLKNSHRYDLIVLRPPVIYGPNEQEVYKLIKFTKKTGIFFAIDDIRLSFVYVDDLIDAIDIALQHKWDGPKIYTICENTYYDFFEIANIIAYHLGQNIKTVAFPRIILDAVFFGLKESGIFFDKINEIKAHLWVCKSNEFMRDFGFKVNHNLFSGMYKTIRWYRENGWL